MQPLCDLNFRLGGCLRACALNYVGLLNGITVPHNSMRMLEGTRQGSKQASKIPESKPFIFSISNWLRRPRPRQACYWRRCPGDKTCLYNRFGRAKGAIPWKIVHLWSIPPCSMQVQLAPR